MALGDAVSTANPVGSAQPGTYAGELWMRLSAAGVARTVAATARQQIRQVREIFMVILIEMSVLRAFVGIRACVLSGVFVDRAYKF